MLGWTGDPAPSADALALRLCGGMHFLVRCGEGGEVEPCYPPASLPEDAAFAEAIGTFLERKSDWLEEWIGLPPQTNEVGRSAVLMSGLLVAANRFGQPIRLFELGASAGLNLQLDRYRYVLGGSEAGDPSSPLMLAPEWLGPPPPRAEVRIAGRAGVDLNPLDLSREADRLLAYVWPDQRNRLDQLKRAIDLASAEPPQVARGDAADWIEKQLDARAERGVVRLVMHSVAFQYFPPANQARILRHLERAGEAASAEAPLAWLRLEKLPEDPGYSLRLRSWPGGDELLAWSHPHGSEIRWLAN